MQSVQLSRVLKQLLESHSVVTLPGLGRLRAYFSPARFKPYAGTFREAKRDVVFEQGDFADDQLLTNAVSEKFGLYPEDARVQVQECINEWSILLHRNHFVEFPELGTLYYGAQGKLCFKLREGVVLPVDESMLTEEQVLHPEIQQNKEKKEIIILKRGKWWVIITAVVLLGSGLYFYLGSRKVAEQQPMWSNLKQKVVPKDPIPVADTLKDTTKTKTVAPNAQASAAAKTAVPQSGTKPVAQPVKAKPVEQVAKPKAARLNVHIVTGSILPKATALSQQKDYKRKGIKTELLTLKNGKYLLSMGLYRTRVEAENALSVQKRKVRSARIIEL